MQKSQYKLEASNNREYRVEAINKSQVNGKKIMSSQPGFYNQIV